MGGGASTWLQTVRDISLHGYKHQKLEIMCAQSDPCSKLHNSAVTPTQPCKFSGWDFHSWSTLSQVQPQQIPPGINVAIPLSSSNHASSCTGSRDSPQQWDQAITQCFLLSCAQEDSSTSLSSSAPKKDRILFLYICRKLVCKLQKLNLHFKPPYHYLIPLIKVAGSWVFVLYNCKYNILEETCDPIGFCVLFFPLEDDHTCPKIKTTAKQLHLQRTYSLVDALKRGSWYFYS